MFSALLCSALLCSFNVFTCFHQTICCSASDYLLVPMTVYIYIQSLTRTDLCSVLHRFTRLFCVQGVGRWRAALRGPLVWQVLPREVHHGALPHRAPGLRLPLLAARVPLLLHHQPHQPLGLHWSVVRIGLLYHILRRSPVLLIRELCLAEAQTSQHHVQGIRKDCI